ncbi:MAG: gamma-glutamyltransferase [Phycisphaerae bacterium]|nr:gamma-glutamyltransferase [Phycisphaerae bacterium]
MWLGWISAGVMAMMAGWGLDADRPTGGAEAAHAEAVARQGMVATSHPLAVQVGVEVLKRGGNAVDAAIAANAVLGVVEPMSCGVGGDLFAIVWDARTRKHYGLNASGRSPYGATRELFARRQLKEIPERGPLSWSVPGCVDGWEMLRTRFGSMSLEEILAPAIACAENGFLVTPVIGQEWQRGQELLSASPDTARTYLRDGRAPQPGERMTNRHLAQTYRRIAQEGRDAFYRGEIARQIVAFSEANGGLFSLRDFAEHTSTWVEPVSTNYRGYDVWELPPNGQGIAVLQILNLLEPFDLRGLGHNTAEYLHLFIEAKKLAYEDRAKFYADPEVEKNLPIAELISKPYAQRRRALIDRERAALALPAGDSKIGRADTVYLSVVDKDRNAVSLIQSIYYAWGSGLVPGDLGFCLQNRGCLFALEEGHPNRLEPHKRPFHTIIPAMVTREGRPWFCFGVMGGDMQPQGQVQVLCNIIDFGMNVQEAGAAARCQHTGSSTPTGSQMKDGGKVTVEAGVSEEAIAGLKAKGHQVSRGQRGFGGYQGILIDAEKGILRGGSDPRKDGCAAGY